VSSATASFKAVAVSHRALARLATVGGVLALTPDDVVAQMSNVASDVAMVEAWAALLSGARLAFLPPDAAGSPDRLEEAIRQQGVTVMFLPAPLFTEIAARRPDTFRHLERPNPGAVHAALHPGGLLLVHAYGHAETGGIAALHPIPGAVPEADSIPIGEPIGGAELYVLDRWLNPVPAAPRSRSATPAGLS
jgi:non-ribosomal peptide synthetase component F